MVRMTVNKIKPSLHSVSKRVTQLVVQNIISHGKKSSLTESSEQLYLPDTDLVDEDASEERQHHVRERVDGVEAGPLRLGKVIGRLLQGVLQRCWVIKAEVATHQEEASEYEHEPAPRSISNQNSLRLIAF